MTGEILPENEPQVNANVPGGGEGTPVRAPKAFLHRIKRQRQAIGMALRRLGNQRQQFVDCGQAPGTMSGKSLSVEG